MLIRDSAPIKAAISSSSAFLVALIIILCALLKQGAKEELKTQFTRDFLTHLVLPRFLGVLCLQQWNSCHDH